MLRVRAPFVFGLIALLPASVTAQFDPWGVVGGKVRFEFHDKLLADAGLAVQDLVETELPDAGIDDVPGLPVVYFLVDPHSDLVMLSGPDSGFVPYGIIGGGVRALGGFTLASPGTQRAVDFHDVSVHAFAVRNDGPGGTPDPDYFAISAMNSHDDDLLVRNVKIRFDPDGVVYPSGSPGDHNQPVMRIMAWDLVLTQALAVKLARPELAGQIIGTGEVRANMLPYDGSWSYPPGQNPNTPYTQGPAGDGAGNGVAPGDAVTDVKLGLLSGLASTGHVGTFPTGRTGMSMSTTSCNVGATQVPWLAPSDSIGGVLQQDHPGIAMQLYRQMGNRFEQVGVSWMKHGFFALANSQCTPCQGGSGQGLFLGIGCSDTYGNSNNSNVKYLGPRSEWNAFLNTWNCSGSYFDGAPVDCLRSQLGSGLNSVDHRLEAFDSDLANPGATYYYEAMYMVRADADVSNNIGSRLCTMAWTGTVWSFTTPSAGNALLAGPAIDRYGEMRTTAGFGADDGNVVLAVQTTDLGGGQWRYEYALFNWNLERQVRQFSVPAGAGATDFYFHDVDDQAGNDWVPAVSGGNLTWTFPDVVLPGHKVGGPLEYGTLYNFGFTSSTAPGDRNAALATQVHGAGGDLLAVATKAPATLNLTASKLAPAVNVPFDLIEQGGTNSAMFVAVSVGGIPLPMPILIGPVPFTGGVASLALVMPPEVAGLEIAFLAGDVTTSPLHLVGLANTMTLKVQ